MADRPRELPERTRFMKGLFAWVGFSPPPLPTTGRGGKRAIGVELLEAAELRPGRSHLLSTMPLRVWTYVGLGVSVLSFLYATFLIFRTSWPGSICPAMPR